MGIAIGCVNEKELLNDLDRAIANDEFILHYQIKYDLKTDEPIGAEVLVRWMHPYYWYLSPEKFIPLFERECVINKLDIYVAKRVCKELKEIIKYKPNFRLSFNISRQGFSDKKTIDEIIKKIEESGLPKDSIEMELTETGFLSGNKEQILIKECKYLSEKGFCLAIDDFGCGFSSLCLLKDIDIDTLKLDRNFLIDNSSKSMTIVKGVVNLAKSLNIKIVAEGIETKEMYDFVKEIGCDYAQGYYLSKPIEYNEFLEKFILN